jgi:hypothetical protein
MADTWEPDQFEEAFVAELGLSQFLPLKTILMLTPDDYKVYLFRNWSTLMFLGQAHLLLGSVHHHMQKLAAGEANGLAAVVLRALSGAIVLSLSAALDSLAGEVDLLLCKGPTEGKVYFGDLAKCKSCNDKPAKCQTCKSDSFRKRLRAFSASCPAADAIEALMAAAEDAKWHEDLRGYRNEAGHRLPALLWLDPCGPQGCYEVHLLKPGLGNDRVWELFSNYVEATKPEDDDLAEPGKLIGQQLQDYLINTAAVVDSVWGQLAKHVGGGEAQAEKQDGPA